MIEGIKLEIPSEEMKTLIKSRIPHHEAKAKFYDEQASKLKEIMKATDGEAVQGGNNNSLTNNTGGLESSAKTHKDKVKFFKFMHDHIIPNEQYRLQHNDLVHLEIISY